MKTSILMTAVLASGSAALVEASDVQYTTQNGYFNWTQDGVDKEGIAVGSYTGFSFSIHDEDFDASEPIDNRGSLTTAVDAYGLPLATPPDEFVSGAEQSLTSIQVAAAPGQNFDGVTHVQFVDSCGSVVSSSSMSVTETLTYDPWQTAATAGENSFTLNVATFTFTDTSIMIGASYDVLFYDAAGNIVKVNLLVTLNGADGYHMLTDDGETARHGYSAAGLTINTTSIDFDGGNDIIPEPSTASLSLLALAGLIARRRRRHV